MAPLKSTANAFLKFALSHNADFIALSFTAGLPLAVPGSTNLVKVHNA